MTMQQLLVPKQYRQKMHKMFLYPDFTTGFNVGLFINVNNFTGITDTLKM
jgi:hypothetical protein